MGSGEWRVGSAGTRPVHCLPLPTVYLWLPLTNGRPRVSPPETAHLRTSPLANGQPPPPLRAENGCSPLSRGSLRGGVSNERYRKDRKDRHNQTSYLYRNHRKHRNISSIIRRIVSRCIVSTHRKYVYRNHLNIGSRGRAAY